MKRILVADDSVTIQKVIALTFADEPFEVQSVGTGSEALELVKSWNPDIVLADVIMPQMNGYELCRAVKQQEGSSSTPVLLLAGTFEAFDEEEANSVGANGFITKPFESGELIEKVKTLIGVVPGAASVDSAPAVPDIPAPVAPEPEPAVPVQAPEPAAPPADEASEPDIWDILSESADGSPGQADDTAPAAAFGGTEKTGVVDVGSFDVGIGRPESQPPPVSEPSAAPPEDAQVPDPVAAPPVAEVQPPAVTEQVQDMDEKSRVENMEKDFFGFETGAVEEVPGSDILDEAVEEVTFEMDEPPESPEVDVQEVSFVVPEPAVDQPAVTGDTVTPDLLAHENSSETAPPFAGTEEVRPAAVEVPVPDSIDIPGFAPEPVPEPGPEPAAAPSLSEISPGVDGTVDQPDEIPVPDPAPSPEIPMEFEPQPDPEPPLELPVDLTPELPEEFSPEPFTQPAADAPPAAGQVEPVEDISEESVSASPDAEPLQTGGGIPDDDAIRKLVEEKVEKIAWEVVPEMAEVIIREAIQKIKDGS